MTKQHDSLTRSATLNRIATLLEQLTPEELHVVHHEIGRRLTALRAELYRQRLTDFQVGDRVVFEHHRQPLPGTVIRINQKTVSVHTDDHRQWRVAPTLLRRLITER